MNKHRKKRNLFAAALLLAAGLLPVGASAQAKGSGVLGKGGSHKDGPQSGVFGNRAQDGGYGIHTEQFGSNQNGTYQITTEQFGNDAPLGSGLFIMAAAGAAYAFGKRKKNNKKHN